MMDMIHCEIRLSKSIFYLNIVFTYSTTDDQTAQNGPDSTKQIKFHSFPFSLPFYNNLFHTCKQVSPAALMALAILEGVVVLN